MADECTGVANKEQLVVCIRWVDNDLEVHEDLIGLHFLESIKSDEIVKVLMDILLQMNISLKNCRGQCYDGASNMSGRKSGVATQLENIESRALYMHCYGHSLTLACQDAIKQNKLMRDTLDDTREITKLIKKSPPCSSVWGDAKDAADDTETKARLGSVNSSMKTFDYFFGCNIGVQLLGYADNLAKALQATKRSAMDGQELAKMTVTTLKSLRNDEAFESLWKQIQSRRENVDVAEPTLPRKRRVPVRYEEGQAPPEFIDSQQDFSKVFIAKSCLLCTPYNNILSRYGTSTGLLMHHEAQPILKDEERKDQDETGTAGDQHPALISSESSF
ncbi:zinc finger MYM-type protein 1-like [Palaemon carinicauda]|uniref:zinc finger MYM-type protein 1-like n=1 Tax=Palaemon carinicauda TaxID=392227 RepID=UPI0035B6378D